MQSSIDRIVEHKLEIVRAIFKHTEKPLKNLTILLYNMPIINMPIIKFYNKMKKKEEAVWSIYWYLEIRYLLDFYEEGKFIPLLKKILDLGVVPLSLFMLIELLSII